MKLRKGKYEAPSTIPLYIHKEKMDELLSPCLLNIFNHPLQASNIKPHVIYLKLWSSYEQIIQLFGIFFLKI
jgi:hypothetical protein